MWLQAVQDAIAVAFPKEEGGWQRRGMNHTKEDMDDKVRTMKVVKVWKQRGYCEETMQTIEDSGKGEGGIKYGCGKERAEKEVARIVGEWEEREEARIKGVSEKRNEQMKKASRVIQQWYRKSSTKGKWYKWVSRQGRQGLQLDRVQLCDENGEVVGMTSNPEEVKMIVRFRASELYDNRVTDEDRRCQPLIVRRRYARRPKQWNEKRWGNVCPGGRVELTDEAWEWIMDKAKLGKRGGMVGMNHDHNNNRTGVLGGRMAYSSGGFRHPSRWEGRVPGQVRPHSLFYPFPGPTS